MIKSHEATYIKENMEISSEEYVGYTSSNLKSFGRFTLSVTSPEAYECFESRQVEILYSCPVNNDAVLSEDETLISPFTSYQSNYMWIMKWYVKIQ